MKKERSTTKKNSISNRSPFVDLHETFVDLRETKNAHSNFDIN